MGAVADLAAHVAEVGLKYCEPDLKAPPNKVITPPVGTCAVSLRIPIDRSSLEQIVLDFAYEYEGIKVITRPEP